MTDYSFDRTLAGYHWNMLQRIRKAVGVLPAGHSVIDGRIVIHFTADLTEVQLEALRAVMEAGDPSLPPDAPDATVFYVADLTEKLVEFQRACGVNLEMYFSRSISESGPTDRIELHAPGVLTDEQKQAVYSAYAGLIQER